VLWQEMPLALSDPTKSRWNPVVLAGKVSTIVMSVLRFAGAIRRHKDRFGGCELLSPPHAAGIAARLPGVPASGVGTGHLPGQAFQEVCRVGHAKYGNHSFVPQRICSKHHAGVRKKKRLSLIAARMSERSAACRNAENCGGSLESALTRSWSGYLAPYRL